MFRSVAVAGWVPLAVLLKCDLSCYTVVSDRPVNDDKLHVPPSFVFGKMAASTTNLDLNITFRLYTSLKHIHLPTPAFSFPQF